MDARSVWVAGATGLVGGHLVDRLLEDPAYAEVHSLGRRELPRNHPKLTHHVVDFDALPAGAPETRVDDAFCALGTTLKKAGSEEAFRKVDLHCVAAFARAARERGAGRFVLVSALGAHARSRVFYNRVKGEAEAAVRAVGFDDLHVLRPSLLMGERQESRPRERLGMIFGKALSPALGGRLRRYRPIRADDVASAMITVAKRGERGARVHENEEILRMAAAKGKP